MRSSFSSKSPEFSEHLIVCRSYGEVQNRCSRIMAEQRAKVQHLEVQAIRLRAKVIRLETELAWAQADRAAHIISLRSLPRRPSLLVQLEVMAARVGAMLRERTNVQWRQQRTAATQAMEPIARLRVHAVASAARVAAGHSTYDPNLQDANQVICQVGCLSHGAYWRDHELCRRSGAPCVLPNAPSGPGVALHRVDAIQYG